MARVLNDENFEAFAAENDGPLLVDFFSDGCIPCRRVAPVLMRLEKEYEDRITFVKVKIAMSPETVKKYKIEAAPTLIVLKDGKEAGRHRGVANADQIEKLIQSVL